MLKKSVMAFVALAGIQMATAQAYQTDSVYTVESKTGDPRRGETNLFKHNWFVGFGLGANMYLGDHDQQMRLFDHFSPMGELYFGKWFTPGLGLRVGLAGGHLKGVSGWTGHKLGDVANMYNYQGFIKDYKALPSGGFTGDVYHAVSHGYPLYETSMHYLHGHIDVMFNLSNMIGGYNAERGYSFIPYVGSGFAHSLERAPLSGKYAEELTLVTGLLNRVRLSNRLDLNVDLRATFAGDHFDQEGIMINSKTNALASSAGSYLEGILSASVGLSYNLGKSNWERSTITTVRVNDNVLADLRKRLEEMEDANSQLRRQLQQSLTREITKETVAAQPLLITFPIDRWTLSNQGRVNLGFLAEVIKANPSMVYSIVGYADRGTGSVKRNIFLARKRSEVIYDCLVKEFGVSESQLRRDDKGGVANMYYNDPRCSRAVLLKVAE